MVRFAVTGAVVALLALTGCGGARQEREKKEQEAAAAEKKLAEGQAFLEGLERERQLLAAKLTEANAQLAQSRGTHRRTLAGAAYLAAEQDSGLVLDVDMSAARDGFLLEQAARQKDREAIGQLAAQALDDLRPCVRTETQEEGEEACPPCEVAPFEDACVGVETNRASSPEWSCASLARTSEGLPPVAFCTSSFEHLAPVGAVKSEYAERDLDTVLQVVRVAFAHQGKLHVSDYPAPEPTLYNPPNVVPLVACQAETDRNQCVHKCEVDFGRYEDPCACEEPEPVPDASGEGEAAEDEEEESPELREAREAAAAAEAEALEAQERAEEARREVQYQQCLASCEPEAEEQADPVEDGESPPRPTSTRVSARLEATPAPGIFVVSRELKVLGPREEVVEVAPLTLVLRQPALVALWQKKALKAEEELGALEEVGRLDVVTQQEGKLALASLPGVEGPVLVGLLEGRVKAFAFRTQPGQEPVVALEPAIVCEAVRAEPKRFSSGVQNACTQLAAAATAAADAGAPEAPVDAGTPQEPVDAGTPGNTVDAGTPEGAADAGPATAPGEVSP